MKIPGLLLVCALALPILGDEGMWLYNEFPKDAVKKAYSFEVTDDFLDSLRLATVKIGASSGSFVSPGGLMLTNREAVANCVAKLSTPEHDLVKNGFYAAANADERPCPGLEAKVLVSLEDVSGQIKEPAPAAPPKEASKNAKPAAVTEKTAEMLAKRTSAIARVEKACVDKTGDACTVVSLSSGERYHLYHYKNYTDLRLVFAPEWAMSFFGGDAATYTYQRYELDIAFLRAYDNGKPAATPHFLKWSAEGVKDTDLLFVAGSPAATSRLDTSSQLIFYRDTSVPFAAQRLAARIDMLRGFTPKGDESRRIAENTLSSLGLKYKSTAGLLIGLRDERLLMRKVNFEKRLRNAVEHDPKLGAEGGKVWDDVATAYKTWTPFERQYQILEQPAAQGSALFQIARQVLRQGDERSKPNEQRLPEYRDSALASTELALYSPAPIDDALETALLTQYLEEVKALGEKEVPLKIIFGSKTPAQLAAECVTSTKLKDVAERKRLAGDKAAATQSDDALLRLVRALDDPARKLLKKHQESLETLGATASEKIAQYRFRIWGPADYPDATSTPRVTFGAVKAYHDRTESSVVFATTFGGLFHLSGPKEPFKLPQRWLDAKAQLDLVTPFDFVSTCDISAGNSGSPTVNKKGELVGMVFDANLEALPSTYMYTDDLARAVHVATQGMAEALDTVYKANDLLKELGVPERKKNGTR
jgi:Peptidase S46